ncbi:sperm microtubule inner protein 8 [Ascaphus truei]|uniref:sperm microtubule inner protein 8 n=1 Tax=Ascaphus truei TaxID=8439 RepID=UPI003F5A6CD6
MALAQDWSGYLPDGRWCFPASRDPWHKLAGVKHTMYHPLLPTLRKMEMDTMDHKLSDEHSRTSTPCTHENFDHSRSILLGVTNCRLPSLEITDTGRQITHRDGMGTMAPLPPGITREEWPSYTRAADDWSKCISSSGEFQLRDAHKNVLGYSGYAVRSLSPDVTGSWRYCLQQNPSLDQYGQKPMPLETLNTFRSFGTSYSCGSYLRPWK